MLFVSFYSDGEYPLWLFGEFNSYSSLRILNIGLNHNDKPIRKVKFYVNYIDESKRVLEIDVHEQDE